MGSKEMRKIDAMYREGTTTFRKVRNADSMVMIQNVDSETGKIENELPIDTPKWARGIAKNQKDIDERRTQRLARLKNKHEEKYGK